MGVNSLVLNINTWLILFRVTRLLNQYITEKSTSEILCFNMIYDTRSSDSKCTSPALPPIPGPKKSRIRKPPDTFNL